jgi:dUTP pyrophosphatase
MSFQLLVKKLHADAKLPVRSTDYSAAYDIYALNGGYIPSKSKVIIKTGISIRMPTLPEPFKVYGSMRSRSGLSVKFNLETGAGVIDHDFCGELCVILYNHGDSDYEYKAHDRISQLILSVYVMPPVLEVEELPELETNRNGGFGSTGL